MKFITIAASALLATSVSAGILGTSSIHTTEDFPVSGKNPLKHCENPADDILEITNVDLDPNPPKPGNTLSIVATGNVKEEIEDGATIHLSVKYGLITIIRTTRDFCEDVPNVGLECPIQKGELKLTKDVDIPKEVPPGKYSVVADLQTKDGKTLTCLTATVEFKRGGGDAIEATIKQDV